MNVKQNFYKKIFKMIDKEIEIYNTEHVIEIHRSGDPDFMSVYGSILDIPLTKLPGSVEMCCAGSFIEEDHPDYNHLFSLAKAFRASVENFFYFELKLEKPTNQEGADHNISDLIVLRWAGHSDMINVHKFEVIFSSPYAPSELNSRANLEFAARDKEEMVKIGRACASLFHVMNGEEY